MKLSDDGEIRKSYKETCNEISHLTSYPYEVVANVLRAAFLCSLDQVADQTIEEDILPNSVEIPLGYYGILRISRDMVSKNPQLEFELIPSESFYKMFFDAYYHGNTPTIKIMKKNLDDIIKYRADNLLRLGPF